jgi:hypothetical protein
MHSRSHGRRTAARRLGRSSVIRLLATFLSLCVFSFSAAVNAASNAVEYTYDAAGNIIKMERPVTSGFGITSIDPASGAVGSTVTVYGYGFSATPANNTVNFNGVAAAVTASASGSISTTVPTGATTGRVTVTVGGVTATSPQDFVVTVPGAPVISNFTPSSGVSGTVVSVSGSSFQAAGGSMTVKLNGVTASATLNTTTAFTFVVPGAAASGRITATNTSGTGQSTSDFIVPPAGVAVGDIETVRRVGTDGPAMNVTVGTAGRHALVLVDLAADQYYTVQLSELAFTPSNAALPYKILKPDNTVLVSGNVGSANRPTIHLPKTSGAGTYTLLISPGIATFNSNIRVLTDRTITTADAPATFGTATALASTRFRFDATQNDGLAVNVSGITDNGTLTVYKPDGVSLASQACAAATGAGRCKISVKATVTGAYGLVYAPSSGSQSAATASITADMTGTLTAGVAQTVSMTREAQNLRLTFAGTSGDVPAIKLWGTATSPAGQQVRVVVEKSDSSYFPAGLSTAGAAVLNLPTLPATGTYSVLVETTYGTPWSGNVMLDLGTSLGVNGTMGTLASTGGEPLQFTFPGTTGQRIEFGLAGLQYGTGSGNTTLNIYWPAGGTPWSTTCTVSSGGCEYLINPLPVSGTYRMTVLPPAGASITAGQLAVSTIATGSFVIGDPAQTLTARPGQTVRYTFSGTAAQLLRLSWTSPAVSNSSAVSVKVLKPDGSTLSTGSLTNGTSGSLDIAALPSTGTYTVEFDPSSGATLSTSAGLATR